MANTSEPTPRKELAPKLEMLDLLVDASEKRGSANSISDLGGLLGYTASGFTKILDELGHYCPEGEVFHHRPRQKPEFTDGGLQLLRLAKEVLAAHRQIRRTHDAVTLTLCCSQLTATEFLPELLRRYAASIHAAGVPEPALVVRERDTPEAFVDLAHHGGFDVAIRGQAYSAAGDPTWVFPDNAGAFKISPPFSFGVIAPPAVIDRPSLGLLEVFGLGPPVGVQIPQALETMHDLRPFRRRVIKFDAHTTLVQMVRRGMCVAIAPHIGLGEGDGLATATIADGHLTTAEFFVLWNRTHAELTQEEAADGMHRHTPALWARSDYIRRFLAVCEEYAREAGVTPF
jgi:DNA-binding transcriptional LysR family regulator